MWLTSYARTIVKKKKEKYNSTKEGRDEGFEIRYLASWICDWLIKCEIVSLDRRSVYVYGLELLISDIVGISCIVLISALYRQNGMWFPYLLGFIPLRIFGGGYHAKSHFTCIVSFSLMFLLLLQLKDSWLSSPYIELFISSFVLCVVLFFSPVEATNKPLSKDQRRRNREKCICIAVMNCFFACVSFIVVEGRFTHALMYFVGSFSAGISIIFALLTKKRQN